ncbi:bacterial transcriptional activator domain-containing protein, partial [Mycobacterium tuberculosis]
MGLDITIQNNSIQEAYVLRLGDNVTIENERWEQELLAAAEQESPRYDKIAELLADYDGGYLRDHDYVWAEGEQARLSALWTSHARKLAAYLEENGREDEALKLYIRLQELDPYQESDGLAILKLYERTGQYDKVIAYLAHLEDLFMDELGLPLPPTISAWREELGLPL